MKISVQTGGTLGVLGIEAGMKAMADQVVEAVKK